MGENKDSLIAFIKSMFSLEEDTATHAEIRDRLLENGNMLVKYIL